MLHHISNSFFSTYTLVDGSEHKILITSKRERLLTLVFDTICRHPLSLNGWQVGAHSQVWVHSLGKRVEGLGCTRMLWIRCRGWASSPSPSLQCNNALTIIIRHTHTGQATPTMTSMLKTMCYAVSLTCLSPVGWAGFVLRGCRRTKGWQGLVLRLEGLRLLPLAILLIRVPVNIAPPIILISGHYLPEGT